MTATIGTYSLAFAALAAAGSAALAAASVRQQREELLVLSRRLLAGFFVLLTIASAALLNAMVSDQFNIAYVASYSERNLALGYKVAAFWAGQEGSLLLWAWLLGGMCVFAVYRSGRRPAAESGVVAVVLGIVCAFFMLMLVFAADPFATLGHTPTDGRGLNPLLQHPSMIAHPPVLFAGYAATTIPFAILFGALFTRRTDSAWVMDMRPWLLVAWGTLTAGILLGAQWAYVELGWGGYWAWDPVENASLLPWLTATALLHTIIMHRKQGAMKWWTASLTTITFLLCLLATYLTRSGVLSEQSVHSFAASELGNMFLVFMGLTVVVSLGLMIWRASILKPETRLTRINSKLAFFLAVNLMLVLITLVVGLGTIWPIISGNFMDQAVSVTAPFYNKYVIPISVVMLALMAFGPLLRGGNETALTLRACIAPTLAAGAGVAALMVMGFTKIWALAAAAIIAFSLAAVVQNLIVHARQHAKANNCSTVGSMFTCIDSDHRRYGGQLAHIGMLMILLGVVGSSVYGVTQTVQMSPGESKPVGDGVVTLERIREMPRVEGDNYLAIQADVHWQPGDGADALTLHPQRRFYDKNDQQAHGEIALHTTLEGDVYVNLAGWQDGGRTVALEVIINPLTSWIWLGGLTLVIAGLFCGFPKLAPVRAARPAQAHPTPTTTQSTQSLESTI